MSPALSTTLVMRVLRAALLAVVVLVAPAAAAREPTVRVREGTAHVGIASLPPARGAAPAMRRAPTPSRSELRPSRNRAVPKASPASAHVLPTHDMTDLPLDGTLPAHWQHDDSRALGRAAIQRIRALRWPLAKSASADRYTEVKADLIAHSELHLYFDDGHLDGILANGFLNAHEVPHGVKVEDYRDARDRTEAALLGAKLEAAYDDKTPQWKAFRPKSLIVEFDLPEARAVETTGGGRFGGISAVFKDAVKHRTSVTPYDSMDVLKGSVDHPMRARHEVFTLEDDTLLVPQRNEYFEGHVWGKLDTSDVKEWLVPHDVAPQTLAKLKATGLPVWEYRETAGSYHRERTRCLARGGLRRIESDEHEAEPPSAATFRESKAAKLARGLREGRSQADLFSLATTEGERQGLLLQMVRSPTDRTLPITLRDMASDPDKYIRWGDANMIPRETFHQPAFARAYEGVVMNLRREFSTLGRPMTPLRHAPSLSRPFQRFLLEGVMREGGNTPLYLSYFQLEPELFRESFPRLVSAVTSRNVWYLMKAVAKQRLEPDEAIGYGLDVLTKVRASASIDSAEWQTFSEMVSAIRPQAAARLANITPKQITTEVLSDLRKHLLPSER